MTRRLTLALVLALATSLGALAQPAYTTAEAVLEANIEATGGRTAWSQVESIHLTQQIATELPEGLLLMTSDAWVIFPTHFFVTTEQTEAAEGMPPMNSTIYVSPEGGFMESAMGRQEFQEPPPELAGQQRAAKEEIALLDDAELELTLVADTTFEDAAAHVVALPDGSKRYYDAQTLLLLAVEASSPMGQVLRRVTDYREVDGLKFGYTQEVEFGGMRQSVTIDSIEINPDISPDQLELMATGGQD